jgi:signal transduction histidine kinase
MSGPRLRRYALLAVVAAAYSLAGTLGLRLASVNASASPVWPPTGIALAALLLCGYRVWPAVLAGAFLVNMTTSGSVAASLGIAIGNTLEGIVGAYLVTRFAGGRDAFASPVNVARFTLFAGILATMVSATIGALSLAATGLADWHDFRPIWLTWWLGDVSGAIVVAPLILTWSANWDLEWDRRRAVEACALMASVLVGSALISTEWVSPWLQGGHPRAFFCIPFLVWAAFRFSPREAAFSISITSIAAVWGTSRGLGAFILPTMNDSLLLVQAFVIVMTVTTLLMAALVREHRHTEKMLRLARSDLESQVQEKTRDLAVAIDALKKDVRARVLAEEALRKLSVQLMRVQDDDGRRIARELHEGIGQDMAALLLTLDGLPPRIERLDPEIATILTRSTGSLRRCIDEILRVSGLLHPPTLEGVGLLTAVKSYLEEFMKRTRIEVTLEAPAEPARLPVDIETVLFRIIQESLENVHLHSGSPTARVRIARDGAHARVEISDAGRGMSREMLDGLQGGVGLTSLRERSREAGGRFEIWSGGGKGTTVQVTIPIPSARRPPERPAAPPWKSAGLE